MYWMTLTVTVCFVCDNNKNAHVIYECYMAGVTTHMGCCFTPDHSLERLTKLVCKYSDLLNHLLRWYSDSAS